MGAVKLELTDALLAKAKADFWHIHAWDKQRHEKDTILSKRDRSQMQYRYFIDFGYGNSVFANFSYGIAVVGISPSVRCLAFLLTTTTLAFR